MLQGNQFIGLQITTSARCQPQVLRIAAGTDKRCLLTLHDAYRLSGIAGKQMLSKEHLFGILKLRSYMRTFTDGTHGIGPSLHPMTVIAISDKPSAWHHAPAAVRLSARTPLLCHNSPPAQRHLGQYLPHNNRLAPAGHHHRCSGLQTTY